MAQYKKKPVVIEAIQWDGDNIAEITPHLMGDGKFVPNHKIAIETLEGTMYADRGDWIIRGVKGELYPCKPDIFSMLYDPEPNEHTS